jgi:hypothetical protein
MRMAPHLWRAVFERDKGYCQYCDADLLASFSAYFSAQVDHVVAVISGGLDTLENFKLACPTCNQCLSRAKHLQTYEERKAYVTARRGAEMNGYLEWRKELRETPSRDKLDIPREAL